MLLAHTKSNVKIEGITIGHFIKRFLSLNRNKTKRV